MTPTVTPEATPGLDRFVSAQAPVRAAVEAELEAGRKRTHWMWFVFPQLRGLGRSETARFYGLADRAEAAAFGAHPVLGPRLRHCTALANAVPDRTAHAIFGSPDDLKFRSCATLFAAIDPAPSVFRAALARFFDGAPDPHTLALLD